MLEISNSLRNQVSKWINSRCLENIPKFHQFQTGGISFKNKGKIRKSAKEYEKAVVGIVSSQPAIVIEGARVVAMGGYRGQNDTLKPAIALAGRVPVKVSEENGRIFAGDLITTSSKAGYGMKCNSEIKCMNSVVGIALDDKKDGEETVLVMVK